MVSKRRSTSSSGVGCTSPWPSGRNGSRRVPNQSGRAYGLTVVVVAATVVVVAGTVVVVVTGAGVATVAAEASVVAVGSSTACPAQAERASKARVSDRGRMGRRYDPGTPIAPQRHETRHQLLPPPNPPTLPAVTTIKGGQLATPEGLVAGDLHFEGDLITGAEGGGGRIDADGLIVAPGLIDIQINGGFGHDFTQDPTTIWDVGRRLPEFGVTAFVPTIVTSPDGVTDLAIDVVAGRRPADYRGAEVLGLHFEGPWISPEMHGAHNVDHIADPDPDVAEKWAGSGRVSIVTLAPERPGASAVLRRLTKDGVVVSVGHTAADFETATRAFTDGATLATHLFNQMTPLRHRDPGTVGAALLGAKHCLLIVDGLHISDGTLEIAWRLLGPDRVILTTDAMAALGLGHGTYPLGDGPVTVGDDGPRTADGRLAGSIVTLPKAIANLTASTSASSTDAIRCATANPASALSLDDRGSLEGGTRADLTLLDDNLEVVATYVGGERLFG